MNICIFSFPLDVIKSCIQGHPLNLPKKSFREHVKERYQSAGRTFKGFYSGVSASVLRAFIVSSSRFLAFETTLQVLNQLFPTHHI